LPPEHTRDEPGDEFTLGELREEERSFDTRRYRPLEPSEVLDSYPAELVESIRYLVSRFQLGETVPFSSRLGVVSALHGEGVTTISRTLAAVIANDCDTTVCWVDLSWCGKAPAEPADVEQPGLYELLTGQADLHDALQKTADDRLMVLEPGHMPDHQRAVIARSPAISDVFDHLEKEFQCVVIDMPPILPGSAGLNTVRYANSYLFVVRHGVTTTAQLRAAATELRSVPALGVVMNRYRSRIPKWLAHLLET
jgi:Mrp family chromosome partitioning ATPase